MDILEVAAEPLGPIPLLEVSGLALGEDRDGRVTVLAVGDRTASVAWAVVEHGVDDLRWQTEDLSVSTQTRIPRKDAQLEAIAADGRSGVLLVQEYPNHAEFFHAPSRELLSSLTLDVLDSRGMGDLRGSWDDPRGSHAEGALLLRGGRLLVVKEKDPAALIEFGPPDESALGFGPGRWLPPGEAWDIPRGQVTLSALAAWYPDQELSTLCPDFSEGTVGILGNLALLSDRGRAVAIVSPRTPGPDPSAGRFTAEVILHVRGIGAKPEGMVILPNGDVLLACDRKKGSGNLFVVRRQQWLHLH